MLCGYAPLRLAADDVAISNVPRHTALMSTLAVYEEQADGERRPSIVGGLPRFRQTRQSDRHSATSGINFFSDLAP